MDCGLIYLKIVSDDISWIQYCNIFGALPSELQREIRKITDKVNMDYMTGMIVPLSYTVQNGCLVKKRFSDKIANDIYKEYTEMISKYTDKPSIRLVYSEGEIEHTNVSNVHNLYSEPLVVNVGRYLDSSYKPGFFKI